MMTLLHDHAVVCMTTLNNKKERKNLVVELSNPPLNRHPYKILEIDRLEIEGMCANMFNLVDSNGKNTVIMSDRARRSYDPEKFEELQENYKVIVANIDMIEHVGGGSTRCMLAEKFWKLPVERLSVHMVVMLHYRNRFWIKVSSPQLIYALIIF